MINARGKIKKLLSMFLLCLTIMTSGIATSGSGLVANAELKQMVENAGLNVGGCILKGGLDFTGFLNSLIFNENFLEELYEPWKDVLYSNQCHAADLLNLLKAEDAIRKQIRKAYYSCNTKDLPKLKTKYYKVLMEIRYVRKVVDRKAVFSLPFGLKLNDPKMLYANRTTLVNELKDKYQVKDKLSKEEFDQFLAQIEIKYSGRIEDYIKCKNSSWQDVVDKWTEFEDFMKGGAGTVDAWEDTQEAWEKTVKKEFNALVDAFKSKEGFSAYFGGILDMNVNGLDPIKGFKEIYADLEEQYYPFVVKTSDQRREGENAARKTEVGTTRQEIGSRFQVKYSATDTNVQNFVKQLEHMDIIIKNSFPAMDAIENCSKTINDRQC